MATMKLVFDARFTRLDHHDGISRYGSNLLAALMKITPVTALIYDERQLKLLPPGVEYVKVGKPTSLRELFLPFKLNRLGATVVYSPMQIMGTFGRRYKLIFTLHDMIYYKFPKAPTDLNLPSRLFWTAFHHAYWPGRLVLNSADVVATVSETSKKEILAAHLTDRPVVVVYNAPPSLPDVKPAEVKPEIVFMGTLMPYKNSELLIRSLPLLPEYRLHLCGRATPDRIAALTALSDRLGVTDRVKIWNGATDAEYADILSRVTAAASASKAEGFGINVIEAMAVGVPFLGSDMEIFHEVGGDAALYFNSNDPKDFASNVRRVENPDTRKKLIKLGYVQAAKFNWADSAQALFEAVQELQKQYDEVRPS